MKLDRKYWLFFIKCIFLDFRLNDEPVNYKKFAHIKNEALFYSENFVPEFRQNSS